MRSLKKLALAALIGCPFGASAEVSVSKIFSSDMMLQRDKAVKVWGKADEGEKVTVKINGQTVSTTAKDGAWKVALKPMQAGGPHNMSVKGSNSIEFENILVGDIWLCGGQSNMDYDISRYNNWKGEIGQQYRDIIAESKSNKNLRMILMDKSSADAGTYEVPVVKDTVMQGKWQTCSEKVIQKMSAVGFVFAQKLQKHINVPVGLIDANKGGSNIKTWMPSSYYKKFGRTPRNMYFSMIASYKDFPIKGFIWYQGESNALDIKNSLEYEDLFKAMIEGWRQDFQDPDMPFLFVQLAAYERNPYQHGITYPVLRDSQKAALELDNTAMAVAIDVGDRTNIHPPKKIPVSERLLVGAKKFAYGEDLVYSGPILRDMKLKGSQAELSFDHVGSGLMVKAMTVENRQLTSDKLEGFEVAGADQKFYPAAASVSGDKVVVSSTKVTDVVAVRYAYKGFPHANLYNKNGYPASPFRTDNFEIVFSAADSMIYKRQFHVLKKYSKVSLSMDQKRALSKIQDSVISKDLNKKITDMWKQRGSLLRSKGFKSVEYKNFMEKYDTILDPLKEKITAQALAAGIFK